MTDRAVQRFYDDLAADYHLIFADWDASIARQSAAFARLIEEYRGKSRQRVLDCSCGIGTQAIGLCAIQHQVVGSDLSLNATRRAYTEAKRRHALLPTVVADMRWLPFASGIFDVILCADNSLPHLLTPADVRAGLRSMARALVPGGLLIITIRDYAEARRSRPPSTLPQVAKSPDGKVVTFQTWDWHEDGKCYDLTHFQIHSDGDSWVVHSRTSTYWAITRDELARHVAEAGLTDLVWHSPEDSGFYQPILTSLAP